MSCEIVALGGKMISCLKFSRSVVRGLSAAARPTKGAFS